LMLGLLNGKMRPPLIWPQHVWACVDIIVGHFLWWFHSVLWYRWYN
jgi:hypothetical protein